MAETDCVPAKASCAIFILNAGEKARRLSEICGMTSEDIKPPVRNTGSMSSINDLCQMRPPDGYRTTTVK